MMRMPLDIGRLHFIGIGGVGMSGIARVLRTLGYDVSGSDLMESTTTTDLRTAGIAVRIGHDPAAVHGAAVVVASSAIPSDNPEILAARAQMIPVVRRAEMLAELMRLKWSIAIGGTHGKTTTTSMIAQMLDSAALDPTVINGGIINAYGVNAHSGSGNWMVVEADESDGTFTRLPATIAVVTNIDPEHLDFYGSFDAVRRAFQTFLENLPFYGFGVVCVDHPEVRALAACVIDRRLISYGLNADAEVRGIDLKPSAEGVSYHVQLAPRDAPPRLLKDVFLPMHGAHNVQNSLAAISIALEMGMDDALIRKALAAFRGVRRRFSKIGDADGVTVIDDYGHHPVEIAAVLRAARTLCAGRVIAVAQPHRYSRLRDLFPDFCACFDDADLVIVTDVYPAGEAPLPGYDRSTLIEGLKAHGHRNVLAAPPPDMLAAMIHERAQSGDHVVCLGAGDITIWAQALPEQLRRLQAMRRHSL